MISEAFSYGRNINVDKAKFSSDTHLGTEGAERTRKSNEIKSWEPDPIERCDIIQNYQGLASAWFLEMGTNYVV